MSLWAVVAATCGGEPQSVAVEPLAMPEGVRWEPSNPRTPSCALEVGAGGRLVLHVELAEPDVDAVIVTGPDPEFTPITAVAREEIERSMGKLRVALPRGRIPEGAGHVVVYTRSRHGAFGAGQALLQPESR